VGEENREALSCCRVHCLELEVEEDRAVLATWEEDSVVVVAAAAAVPPLVQEIERSVTESPLRVDCTRDARSSRRRGVITVEVKNWGAHQLRVRERRAL